MATLAVAAIAIGWQVSRRAHDPATALAEATQALARAPGEPRAVWERAQALAALGLSRSAAMAFDEIAQGGQGGRSDEARARAAALRAAWQTPEHDRALAAGAATLQESDAATAFARARAAGGDARDPLRRLLLALAAAARAQGKSALADAYVDEARTLL